MGKNRGSKDYITANMLSDIIIFSQNNFSILQFHATTKNDENGRKIRYVRTNFPASYNRSSIFNIGLLAPLSGG